jgi:Mlc titration factor MtfA (ptsG expression regulator)
MQIIYKIDRLFIKIYSFLILLMGGVFTIASGNPVFIPITLFGEGLYLFFALRRPLRRRRAVKQPLPLEWKKILSGYTLFYDKLDPVSKQRFEDDIKIFLRDYSIEGQRRQEQDLKTKLLVAAGFATVLNGRPEWEPPIKDGVLVFPGSTFNRDYETGRGMRAGQAMVNSPLIVTRQSLDESFADAGDGFNVIYHELAHYFDFEDGAAEGVPSTRLEPGKVEQWRRLIKDEWQKAGQGRSFLRDYAATNEAETFAVAAEVFFETPRVMLIHNPEMYEAFKDFFNLDPLGIIEGLDPPLPVR